MKNLNIDLSYDTELKFCEDTFRSIKRYIDKQRSYTVDMNVLQRAFEKAKELHGNSRRYSGLLYLRHPLAVMESLSRLFCKTSILAAALLHDTMEDCGYTPESMRESFSPEIVEIVSAVTAIKVAETDVEGLSGTQVHDLLDRLTDAKLIRSKYQREALLVRFADREHNMATLNACAPEKRRLKVEQTETFLIPAAKQLGMRYFETVLNDYCLKSKDDDFNFGTIRNARNDYISVSGPIFSKFDNLLLQSIKAQKFFSFPPYNPFARLRGGKGDRQDELQIEQRRILRPYEIKCQLGDRVEFGLKDVYLSEVLLLCNSQEKKVILSQFLAFYREYLRPNQLFFEYDHEEGDIQVVCLSDQFDNNYRIVLVPQKDLEAYFIGDPVGEPLTLISDDSTKDALRPKMKVYAYSHYKGLRVCSAPRGATALDFAFIVSQALALTVRGAYIKKYTGESISFSEKDARFPLKTILEDDDVVYFDADYIPHANHIVNHASIDWFSYINTEHARNRLIEYFKTVIHL